MSISLSDFQSLPFLEHLTDEERMRMEQCAYTRSCAKSSLIYSPEQECLGLVMVLSGEVRAVMLSQEGREIVLYRLKSGETDVLSASCVVNQITFETQMISDTDCELLIIPAVCLSAFKENNIHVRCFIFEKLGERFSDVMHRMQEMLFTRVDSRLAQALLHRAEQTGKTEITVTHEQLAADINSSREVVSRTLKSMEKQNLLRLGRGRVTVLDKTKLLMI